MAADGTWKLTSRCQLVGRERTIGLADLWEV
jgi:hypothetical protein